MKLREIPEEDRIINLLKYCHFGDLAELVSSRASVAIETDPTASTIEGGEISDQLDVPKEVGFQEADQ